MAVIGITFTVRPPRRAVEITKVMLPSFLWGQNDTRLRIGRLAALEILGFQHRKLRGVCRYPLIMISWKRNTRAGWGRLLNAGAIQQQDYKARV